MIPSGVSIPSALNFEPDAAWSWDESPHSFEGLFCSTLWKMPNVILTPHISGSTGSPGFGARIREIFSQNVTRFVSGEPLLNRIPEGDLIPRVA